MSQIELLRSHIPGTLTVYLGWPETIAILSAAITAVLWAREVEQRPVDLRRPRIIPPLAVMATGMIVALLMLAHLITLATGQPFTGHTRF